MKTTNMLLASLAGPAAALIQMQVRYSDEMVDVGSLDTFASTWQTIYGTSGSEEGVVTDNTYYTNTATCRGEEDTSNDLTVKVTMNGAWGKTTNLRGDQTRDAIVNVMWESINAVAARFSYQMYEQCAGLTWQDSVIYTETSACGGMDYPYSCSAYCQMWGTPDLVQCQKSVMGAKLPSTMRITAYEDGVLLADDLTLTFAAADIAKDSGCGIVGDIAAALATYTIPVAGEFFAQGIQYECS